MSEYIKTETMWRLEDGRTEEIEDFLVRETSLELFVNGQFLQSLKCLPGDLDKLAVGFLVSEGYLSKAEDLVSLTLNPDKRTVLVVLRTPPDRMEYARLLREKSPELDPVTHVMRLTQRVPQTRDGSGMRMAFSDLVNQFAQFIKQSETFNKVGGVHAAALSDGTNILYHADDVSRHNAMDRVIGAAFLDGRELGRLAVFTTGRLHVDMVAKLAVTGIPCCVTRSAPTCEALALAQHCGLTLCGRVRSSSALVFCGLERLCAKP